MTRPALTRTGHPCVLLAAPVAVPLSAPWVVVDVDTLESRAVLRALNNADRDAVIDGVLRAGGVRS